MREIRSTAAPVELRVSGDGRAVLAGYAAVFPDGTDGSCYRYGSVTETIAPGAFARALRDKQDVRALFNHDSGNLLGRLSSGTLRLQEDQTGLRYEIDLPDTTQGRDVRTLVERGDLSGSSFAFRVKTETWRKDDTNPNCYLREIGDVDLIEVGPVTFPAYAGTQAAMRSEDIEALEAEAEAATGSEAQGGTGAGSDGDAARSSGEAEVLELRIKLINLGVTA
ncbi:MAG: HK97 family phage prohead protease [Lentisphaeria bacterium]|nr:HK97 family phage prohead protease [Lentisphaeria bacterium]